MKESKKDILPTLFFVDHILAHLFKKLTPKQRSMRGTNDKFMAPKKKQIQLGEASLGSWLRYYPMVQ